jgi:hypothetical protein
MSCWAGARRANSLVYRRVGSTARRRSLAKPYGHRLYDLRCTDDLLVGLRAASPPTGEPSMPIVRFRSIKAAKRKARHIQRLLTRLQHKLPLRKAYEAAAQAFGYLDWHELERRGLRPEAAHFEISPDAFHDCVVRLGAAVQIPQPIAAFVVQQVFRYRLDVNLIGDVDGHAAGWVDIASGMLQLACPGSSETERRRLLEDPIRLVSCLMIPEPGALLWRREGLPNDGEPETSIDLAFNPWIIYQTGTLRAPRQALARRLSAG